MAKQMMQHVAITTLRNELPGVLDVLQEQGSFEFVAPEQAADMDLYADAAARLADLDFVIRQLQPHAAVAKGLAARIIGDKVVGDDAHVAAKRDTDFSRVIAEVQQIVADENQLRSDQQKRDELLAVMRVWEGQDLPVDINALGLRTQIILGSVDQKDADDFVQEIGVHDTVALEQVTRGDKHLYFILAYGVEQEEGVQTVMTQWRAQQVQMPELTGTIEDNMASLVTEQMTAEQELAAFTHRKAELAAEHLPQLKLAADAALWEVDQAQAAQAMTATAATVTMTGWVPAQKYSALVSALEKRTPYIAFEQVETQGEVPAYLENKGWFRPFETVTSFFGMPKGAELDPTPFVAPFFALFFGFCLTDAGYGLLMTLFFGWALWVLPKTREIKSILMLMLMCGVSTTIMGVLFGGYFGMTTEQFMLLANGDTGRFYGQIFHPTEDLVPNIMLFAYGLGVTQLCLGVVLGFVQKIRGGDRQGAFLVSLPTLLIVLLGIVWGLVAAEVGAFRALADLSSYFLFIMIALFALVVWGSGSGNIIVRPLLGFLVVANEIIGWAGNVLSYSRLFALGLATGIIAMSFNQIALTVGEGMPLWLGLPIMIVIILFGHTLNLGLNFIGALVHTARLQFVEFFGQFYEGGARLFTPLRRRTKYLFIKS